MNRIPQKRLGELALLFLKLGIVGFGGPAAHIAMMEDEVVARRHWLTRSQFLDLVGATNLIPGPNSTEMAIHVGYLYGGLLGLIAAGVSFISPAVLITGFFAWIYREFGTLPQVAPLLKGIEPVVLGVIFVALWRLGKKALKNRQLWFVGLAVVALLLGGLNETIALLLGGLFGAIWLTITRNARTTSFLLAGLGLSTVAQGTSTAIAPSLWQLGLFFLKVGSILFGSGYVLVAFLEGEVVGQYGWLTQQQLLDAIAIGQFTPGPVLSTATFIGYLILGIPGAIVATIGIFIPSFLFVLALNPIVPKLRQSKWTSAFLDAVNVSAVALMAFVTLNLARTVLLQPSPAFFANLVAVSIALVSAILLLRFSVNPAWLVLVGMGIGWLFF